MIDEAFIPFEQIIEQLLSFRDDMVDEESGMRLYISGCEIESPVELDVAWDENGVLQIGSTPPLYNVNTTFKPSFHKLRFVAQRTDDNNGK
jgi:hypothetical protein